MATLKTTKLKKPIVVKNYSRTFPINVGIINKNVYQFDGLNVVLEDVVDRVESSTQTLNQLQQESSRIDSVKDAVAAGERRDILLKTTIETMVMEGLKIVEQEQLQMQALYDFIMAMIVEVLILPSGVPRDKWISNQLYYQDSTNIVMSGIQSGGALSGQEFENNFVNNLNFYNLNSAYYSDFVSPFTKADSSNSFNSFNSINRNVYSARTLARNYI